jgi:hypothetical protein
MQLVGVYVWPIAEILLIHKSRFKKMGFISHEQIVNKTFILVQKSQEFMTKICAADYITFF